MSSGLWFGYFEQFILKRIRLKPAENLSTETIYRIVLKRSPEMTKLKRSYFFISVKYIFLIFSKCHILHHIDSKSTRLETVVTVD